MIARLLTAGIVALGAVVPSRPSRSRRRRRSCRTGASRRRRRRRSTVRSRPSARARTRRGSRGACRWSTASATCARRGTRTPYGVRARTAARADRGVCAAEDRRARRSGRARRRHEPHRARPRRRRQARAAALGERRLPDGCGRTPVHVAHGHHERGEPALPREPGAARQRCRSTSSAGSATRRRRRSACIAIRRPTRSSIGSRLVRSRQRHAAPGRHMARSVSRRARARDAQDAHRDREDQSTRVSFVNALAQTRQPGTADALLTLAQNDADPKVRAEAVVLVSGARGRGRHQRDAGDHRQGRRRQRQEARGLRPQPPAERRRHPDAHRARSAEVEPSRPQGSSLRARPARRTRARSRSSSKFFGNVAGGPDRLRRRSEGLRWKSGRLRREVRETSQFSHRTSQFTSDFSVTSDFSAHLGLLSHLGLLISPRTSQFD